MSYVDLSKIREELIVFLRNSDVFSVAQRGVTTTTEEFDGDDNEKNFTLSNTPVRNIRSITIGGVAQVWGTDYEIDYLTAIISFTTAPASGSNNVDVEHDYGSPDKIFPDFPQSRLSISSFPRISIDVIGISSDPAGFGNVQSSEIDFSVIVFATSEDEVSTYIDSIRQATIANYNSFIYLDYVRPLRVGAIIKSPFEKGGDKIRQRNIDFRSHFNYEIN